MSHHQPVPRKPANDPTFALPGGLAKLSLPLLVVGLFALVGGVALACSSVDVRFGMSAYLTALMYGMSIAIGSLFFVMIQHLSRARWSVVVRRLAELMMIMIVPMIILFIPILWAAFSGNLYAWSIQGWAADRGIPEDLWLNKARYLNPTWFTVRAVVCLAVYSFLALYYFRNSRRQDETGEVRLTEKMQTLSGPGVILFAACTSFVAFDWLMSLAPMWYSTMIGVYVFTGCVLSAHAAVAVLSLIVQRAGAIREEVTVEHYHDLAKYMFGFIVFWGYIGFSQYMLIWYSNIPEEAHWYSTRSENGWWPVSVALPIFHFIVPLFGLMSMWVRRRPWAVAFWGMYLLILHLFDVYWMIMPEATEGFGGAVGVIAVLVSTTGMVALLLGVMLRLAGEGRMIPVRDPRLGASLAFENV